MTQITAADRVRAFGHVIIAGIYFYIAQSIAVHAANGLSTGVWLPLIERIVLLFLLVVGYAAMGRAFNRRREPIRDMGLVFRPGWQREFGLGAALGWGMLLASILPLVLSGGLIITFWAIPRQFGILLIDLLVLAVASLAEEVTFRGYPFQRLIDAMGPTLATIVFSFVFAGLHMFNPGASRASFMVTVFSSWLLSVAYLRTRALWICWGWHFAWNTSMCLLFGLPVSGITQFSPVIQSNTVGPTWMTGGDYGPEASTVAAIVLLIGIFVVYRTTRSLAYLHTQPVIVPAGIPVDLDAMSNTLAPHHPVASQAPPAGSTLVQIDSAPVPSAPRTQPEEPPE
ncbi:MAG TPA: type II CAAX endopeptidase family protein [Acidobacteriaceae bacterium]|nr:type II CAAX endopeptidase family protein [Acidobacteriaceae bacterium]